MGVFGLKSFCEENGVYSDLDILAEIRNYRKNNAKAIIIFDMMCFIRRNENDVIKMLLGGNFIRELNEIKKFLERLRNAGATLVFYCDGSIQMEKLKLWCDRRTNSFAVSEKILRAKVWTTDSPRLNLQYACKPLLVSLLKVIEQEEIGEVVITSKNECDAEMGKYAFENNAFAILSDDTDFLIFEGAFQLWECITLCLDDMKGFRFDRKALREKLSLTDVNNQMKILAAMGGNDRTKKLISNYLRKNYNEVAVDVRSLESKSGKDLYREIAQKMNIEPEDEILKSIEHGINLYNTDFESETSDNRFAQYCASNVLMDAFSSGRTFQYDADFLDFPASNNSKEKFKKKPFINSIVVVFRKLGGIVLENNDNLNAVTIATKYQFNRNFDVRKHRIIRPPSKNGIELKNIIFEDDAYNIDWKWEYLLWSLGLKENLRHVLNKMLDSYVAVSLALIFLKQSAEITSTEADALLTTYFSLGENFINWKEVPIRNGVPTEMIRVVQLFYRTLLMIWDCLYVCGLSKYILAPSFDGSAYVWVKERFDKRKNSEKDFYRKSIQKIDPYRIYNGNWKRLNENNS